MWWRVFLVPMYDPPLPPLSCVGVWIGLGFSRNCLGFFSESDQGGAIFRFFLWIGACFLGGCVTPPLPFFRGGFSGSFSWEESWIRLTGLFFRIFLYFILVFYLGYACAARIPRAHREGE